MLNRETHRYMKNMNKLFGSTGQPTVSRKRTTASLTVTKKKSTSVKGDSVTRPRSANSRPSKTVCRSDKRVIEWQHYEHIFAVMDNLKYQFPAVGYERFFDMFITLFKFYSESGLTSTHFSASSFLPLNEADIQLVSSFGIDPAYYGRLIQSDLYTRILLPIFGAVYGTFERTALEKVRVKGRGIATSFYCNAALSRLVLWTRVLFTRPSVTSLSEDGYARQPLSSTHRGDAFDEAVNAFEDADQYDFQQSTDSQASRQPTEQTPKGKKGKKTADRAVRPDQRGQDATFVIKREAKHYQHRLQSLSIHSTEPNWCDCCLYSYRIIVAFGDTDEGTDWKKYYQSLTLPAVYVNVAVLLSWPLTPEQFAHDFTLDQAKGNNVGDRHLSSSFLDKTRSVYRMGFYQRLYSVHLWIYFITMWLWNCHRAAHQRYTQTLLSENRASVMETFTAFPIQLVVQKKLRKLFELVPSLPLSKLLKTRKIVIQYR